MSMHSGNGFAAQADDSSDIGRSVMKWSQNGELSALDLQTILQRLSAVDDQAATLMDCPLDLPG